MKRLIFGFLCLCIGVVVGYRWKSDFENPLAFRFRSDAEMIDKLRENRVKLEAFVEMAKADVKFENIHYDRNPGPSDERWEAYRDTFEALGVRAIISAPNLGGYVFYAESCGTLFSPVTEFCSDNGSKGYIYSTAELTPQFDSLDIPEKAKVGGSFVGRKIEKNWFLFFRFPG